MDTLLTHLEALHFRRTNFTALKMSRSLFPPSFSILSNGIISRLMADIWARLMSRRENKLPNQSAASTVRDMRAMARPGVYSAQSKLSTPYPLCLYTCLTGVHFHLILEGHVRTLQVVKRPWHALRAVPRRFFSEPSSIEAIEVHMLVETTVEVREAAWYALSR